MKHLKPEPLAKAYELTLRTLDLHDHDPIADIVAEEISEIGYSEGREPKKIAQEAINRLQGLGQSV